MGIKDLSEADFSRYGEMMVLTKLEEYGWWCYRPEYDRYIDLVALKIVCERCNEKFPDYNKLQCTNCNREVSKRKVKHGKICPICNTRYANITTLICNNCNIPLKDNPLCPYCGKGIVDLKPINCQKCGHDKYKFRFRTIQVKSSRDIDNHRNFGLTMKPKDLINDPRHFFVWFFIDTENPQEPKYLVMSVEDYKRVMGNEINSYSFRISQNRRQHINKRTLKEGDKDWSQFLNRFDKLEQVND